MHVKPIREYLGPIPEGWEWMPEIDKMVYGPLAPYANVFLCRSLALQLTVSADERPRPCLHASVSVVVSLLRGQEVGWDVDSYLLQMSLPILHSFFGLRIWQRAADEPGRSNKHFFHFLDK